MATQIEVWLDESGQFVRQRAVGDVDVEAFKRIDDETARLIQGLRDPQSVRILFDARECGKASYQARRAMVETQHRPDLHRIAVFGAPRVGRLMMRFVLVVSGEKKIGVFAGEREAIEWLLS
jgi:hypothetical protein